MRYNAITLSKVTDVANILFSKLRFFEQLQISLGLKADYTVPKQICLDIHHLILLSDTEDREMGQSSKIELFLTHKEICSPV